MRHLTSWSLLAGAVSEYCEARGLQAIFVAEKPESVHQAGNNGHQPAELRLHSAEVSAELLQPAAPRDPARVSTPTRRKRDTST